MAGGPPGGQCGRAADRLRGCLRSDRRRGWPWLAGMAAVIAAAWAAGRPLPLVLAAAAVVTVAALGDPPQGLAGPVGGWIAGRTLGPAVAGAIALAVLAPPRAAAALVAAWLAGSLAAAAMFLVTLGGGRSTSGGGRVPSSAAGGVAVLSVFGAAAVLAGADGPWAFPAAGGLWLVTAGAGSLLLPRLTAPGPTVSEWLTAAAMLSTLAGMVGWLFLLPEHAVCFTWLVAAWFLALAVPRTALAAGVLDERLRRRIVPVSREATGRTVASITMILGWPLVVAACLATDRGVVEERLAVAVGLLAAAALTAGVTRLVLGSGRDRETAQLLVVAVLFLAVTALPEGFWP
jgi:hypothetical protein